MCVSMSMIQDISSQWDKPLMLFQMLELAVRLGKKKATYTGTLPQTKTTGPKRASSWLDRFENRASYIDVLSLDRVVEGSRLNAQISESYRRPDLYNGSWNHRVPIQSRRLSNLIETMV